MDLSTLRLYITMAVGPLPMDPAYLLTDLDTYSTQQQTPSFLLFHLTVHTDATAGMERTSAHSNSGQVKMMRSK
jgi:hypothetical protein